MPDNEGSEISLPERFQQFFVNKLEKISESLSLGPADATTFEFPCQRQLGTSLRSFEAVSEKQVAQIIKNSSTTTCNLDAIPTCLLKKCCDDLVPVITSIINKSFQAGCFPEALKQCNICPLIKDRKLDSEELKNYRPIANLKFLAKTVERAAAQQLRSYLAKNQLLAKTQSAYRLFHSCETALLRVSNDILMSLDKGHEVILVLLDYSSAFDTISHDTILQRMSDWFGIQDRVLDWFRTYLTSRTQTVLINGVQSSVHMPTQGVPQGSVIGPLVFTMYTSPLENIIDSYGFSKMLYADDTQIYVSCKSSDIGDLIPRVLSCIKEIKEWSRLNGLKLNSSKTEVLHIKSRFRSHIPLPPFQIDGVEVVPVKKVRNLGVLFDDQFTMHSYVSSKCRSASFALQKISKIRPFIDKGTTEKLVHAFVMCHLDYCNSLLYGVPDIQFQKLQVIQNSAARLVTRTNKRESISSVLRALHWLPIKSRVKFKILLLAFHCFHDIAPSYLSELVVKYEPVRNLRSIQKDLYNVPVVRTKWYGKRGFAHAAPELWNSIPCSVRQANTVEQFKTALKTYLFN